MLYQGKKVWTEDAFDYQKVQIGDYVEQAIVDNAMNCLHDQPVFPDGRALLAPGGPGDRDTASDLCDVQKGRWGIPQWHLAVLWSLLPWRECGARQGPHLLLSGGCRK